MKLELPEIYWHGDKERIMTIDFSPVHNQILTGGTDSQNLSGFIKLWQYFPNQEKEKFVEYLGNVEDGHKSTVNCLKFSPTENNFASASDDRSVIIWELREKFVKFGSEEKEIGWAPFKVLLGHTADVFDLQWSNNGKFLISGSIDNSAIIYDVEKAKVLQRLDSHSHFVQGVALDPKMKYAVTQSSDRSVKIWKNSKGKNKKMNFYTAASIKKLPFQDGLDDENKVNSFRLFIDENSISTFFRRPDFSPDGSILLLPTSQYQASRESQPVPCILVFRRGDFSTPCAIYYSGNKPVIAIKFNQNLYQTEIESNKRLFNIPYKMIFAVGTLDSIFVFTTECSKPILVIGNIHCSPITDLSWKRDASILGVSSSDGYCSFLTFEKGELGKRLEEGDIEDEKIKKIIFQRKEKSEKEDPIARKKSPNIINSGLNNQIEIERRSDIKIEEGKKKIVPMVVKSFN